LLGELFLLEVKLIFISGEDIGYFGHCYFIEKTAVIMVLGTGRIIFLVRWVVEGEVAKDLQAFGMASLEGEFGGG
jgi:hypothetical protein